MIRRAIAILLCALALGAVLLSSGCGWSDPSAEERTKSDLEAKYGEEFMVFEVKGESLNGVAISGHQMTCAPVKDETMKFWVGTADDGEVLMDEYVQTINGRQITELITPVIEEMASDYYINTEVDWYKYTDWEQAATLDNLIGNQADRYATTTVIISEASLRGLSYNEEFQVVESFYSSTLPITASFEIWFTDPEKLDECRQYFSNTSERKREFYNMMKEVKSVGFGVASGSIRITEDEYLEQRNNGKNNRDPEL